MPEVFLYPCPIKGCTHGKSVFKGPNHVAYHLLSVHNMSADAAFTFELPVGKSVQTRLPKNFDTTSTNVPLSSPIIQQGRVCSRCFFGVTMINAIQQAALPKRPSELKKWPVTVLLHQQAVRMQ